MASQRKTGNGANDELSASLDSQVPQINGISELDPPRQLKLPRDFYARRTLTVARELIGMHLVRAHRGTHLVGRIVETEAYQGPRDLAAHSARGRTERTAVMYGAPGHAYVYLIYGMWDCLNVVTREEGIPHAVLIRAVEPVSNLRDKTWGPGLLCKAMHIDRRDSGMDLCGESLWIGAPVRDAAPQDRTWAPHRRGLRRLMGAQAMAVLRPQFALCIHGERCTSKKRR